MPLSTSYISSLQHLILLSLKASFSFQRFFLYSAIRLFLWHSLRKTLMWSVQQCTEGFVFTPRLRGILTSQACITLLIRSLSILLHIKCWWYHYRGLLGILLDQKISPSPSLQRTMLDFLIGFQFKSSNCSYLKWGYYWQKWSTMELALPLV